MDSGSTKQVALLSIRPQFAQMILNGEKKVEFRKAKFRNRISHVVVYATSPVQRILGYFEVSHVDEDSPERLWIRYSTVGGASYEEFRSYYARSARGIAIGVGKTCPLRQPVPLSFLDDSLSAPQSFSYITDEAFEMVKTMG